MERSALLAVPLPRNVRPGARALSVAIEFAVTGAMRVSGFGHLGAQLDRRGLLGRDREELVGIAEQQRPFTGAEVVTPRSSTSSPCRSGRSWRRSRS
jgi:hypothetical protein